MRAAQSWWSLSQSKELLFSHGQTGHAIPKLHDAQPHPTQTLIWRLFCNVNLYYSVEPWKDDYKKDSISAALWLFFVKSSSPVVMPKDLSQTTTDTISRTCQPWSSSSKIWMMDAFHENYTICSLSLEKEMIVTTRADKRSSQSSKLKSRESQENSFRIN